MLAAQAAAGRIVGGDKAGVSGAVDGRVEDHDRDAGRDCVLDVLLHRLGVERRQPDAVDAHVHHVLDDFLLLGDLGLGERPFPFDRDAEFLGRVVRADLDRLPKLAARALGNHGERDRVIAFRFASGGGLGRGGARAGRLSTAEQPQLCK